MKARLATAPEGFPFLQKALRRWITITSSRIITRMRLKHFTPDDALLLAAGVVAGALLVAAYLRIR